VAWTTFAIAIYGAVLATVTTVAGVLKVKADRRERASPVVGGVIDFLSRIKPDPLIAGIPTERIEEAITELSNLWDPIRRDLEALRVADPRLDTKASQVITTVDDSFHTTIGAARERRRPRAFGPAFSDAFGDEGWEEIHAKYEAATKAAADLKGAVRRPGSTARQPSPGGSRRGQQGQPR
jgi:hypothetical protein